MFAEKALELVKELQRTRGQNLPPYNADMLARRLRVQKIQTQSLTRLLGEWFQTQEDLIKQVLDEMKTLFEQNQEDVKLTLVGKKEYYPAIQMRHAGLERNKRCLLAYLHNRISLLRKMRWDLGSVLPPEIKCNLSDNEIQWFTKYNRMLATYMRSVGDHGGLDLTQDTRPPKSLYIEVRCLQDHGEFETQDGNTILLSKNSQHFLMRSECEHLIRQGILEHIVN